MPRRSTAASASPAPLEEAADRAAIDPAELETRVSEVLEEPLYWFGVRHHSPTVARHLAAAIEARRPRVLFIEGPADANDLVEHVVDPATRPPIAIYSSYRDDDNVLGLAGILSAAADVPPRFSVWYPFVSYSPEYVAMRLARKMGIPVVFIDLPHHALLRPRKSAPDAPAGTERRMAESHFYRRLTELAGYRTWDEAWDSLFEFSDAHPDPETFRRHLAWFCAACRSSADPARIATDGTLERERFMRWTIERELAARKFRPSDAMVVCGGFHLFLERHDATPPPEPPAGTVYRTVVPYSYFRVSELSGYGAGNRAPHFYQAVWESFESGTPMDEAMTSHLVTILQKARKAGEPLSSADAIAIHHQAKLLARLRGRPRAILDDLHDALVTCCVKGDPAMEGQALQVAIDAVDIGTRVGKVTPKLGQLPIVRDFYDQVDSLELGAVLGRDKKIVRRLDKRDSSDLRASVFLHRLRYLEVPLAELAGSGAPATTLFQEEWRLAWSPRVEDALVERNLYGDSIEKAALARLEEDLRTLEHQAGSLCERLVRSLDMDLPGLVGRLEEATSRAIDTDGRFPSLAQALVHLLVLDQYAAYRQMRREGLSDLIVRAFGRAAFAIPAVANAPPEEEAEIVRGLLSLAETLLGSAGHDLDRDLFVEHVKAAAADSRVPFLRGVFHGTLAEIRVHSPEALAAELAAYARSTPETRVQAGDFLDGILAVSKTSILLGAAALIGAIDELLRACDWDGFLVILPRMRAAFERLHERQRDAMASRVAERYGLEESASLETLSTSVAAGALIARIDETVARILSKWNL